MIDTYEMENCTKFNDSFKCQHPKQFESWNVIIILDTESQFVRDETSSFVTLSLFLWDFIRQTYHFILKTNKKMQCQSTCKQNKEKQNPEAPDWPTYSLL